MKRIMGILSAVMLVSASLLLASCGSAQKDKTIKFVAANLKVYEDTTELLAQILEEKGYKLDYKFLGDNTQLNRAVENGEADANYHQHIAYLNEFNALHKTHLVPAFKAFTDASGIFSKKYKSIEELPDGATFSIPVDPANNFRTLVMLQDAGLIKLKEGIDPIKATVEDIVENPKNFKFTELDYTMLVRALDDVDAGFLYATLAYEAGLDYQKDALVKEREEFQSPDIIAVHEKNKDSEKIKALQEAYQSDRMKQALKDIFGGKDVLIPGW
ncbi:MAG: methionine ABC transporter substrate-binding protein [Cohnella sp.]|uniref:MetQ/NlpA family ABC transporter substrate-binding protein n=1 Tax=Cohnella sp. TaxID=1883426 RepID=UPI000E370F58|nr:MetQ/NlpA family ABC transporter substrate-binding protein [Cohnella sp.]REK60873.1 MAG: methionine ABC transporter substrate-binding protein [Cohnella sp.]